MSHTGYEYYKNLVGLSFTISEKVKEEVFEPRGLRMGIYTESDIGFYLFLHPFKKSDRSFYLSKIHEITYEDLWADEIKNPCIALRII